MHPCLYGERIFCLRFTVGVWFRSASPFRGLGSLQINMKLFWVITFTLWCNISTLMGVVCCIHRAWGGGGSLHGLMWLIHWGLHSHYILWELNACRTFRTTHETALSFTTTIRAPKEGLSFGETAFIPPVNVQRTVSREHWSWYSGTSWQKRSLACFMCFLFLTTLCMAHWLCKASLYKLWT